VDVHLSVRAFPIGLGDGRDSLESRGKSAAAVEVPQLQANDLARGFEKAGRWLTRSREFAKDGIGCRPPIQLATILRSSL
jgi:hypothetical protein